MAKILFIDTKVEITKRVIYSSESIDDSVLYFKKHNELPIDTETNIEFLFESEKKIGIPILLDENEKEITPKKVMLSAYINSRKLDSFFAISQSNGFIIIDDESIINTGDCTYSDTDIPIEDNNEIVTVEKIKISKFIKIKKKVINSKIRSGVFTEVDSDRIIGYCIASKNKIQLFSNTSHEFITRNNLDGSVIYKLTFDK